MADNIPQSVAYTVVFKAYLSDGVTAATGKTIAITISKNTAAFGNPSAGATNATEIASGWYYVALSTTDTGTLGPVIVHGAVAGVDNVDLAFYVVNANTGGWAALPNAAAGANTGLPVVGTQIPNAVAAAVGGLLTGPTTANTGLADVTRLLGTAIVAPATAGLLDVNVKQISTDGVAADNLEADYDGTQNNAERSATAKFLADIIESQRGHHTWSGNIYYVDGFGGNDTTGNGSRALPYKTISKALTQCVAGRHDIVECVANSGATPTVISETATITVSKSYVFIRGPGRGVQVDLTGNGYVFDITAVGVEISGFDLIGNGAGGSGGITISTADFAYLHNLWITSPTQDGIQATVSNNTLIDNVLILTAGRDGVRVASGAGTGQYTRIINSTIRDTVGSAVNLLGSDASECHIRFNVFRDNAIALSIAAGVVDTVVTDNRFTNNTTTISDAGTRTLNMWNNIADDAWNADATSYQVQGSFGQAIGDPVADTNTIYKAVVTDATGANVAIDVGAIKTKTDFMPSVTAGAAGGLFIAGANAATSITTALTANITGNVSGSVNSVATGVTVTTNNDKTGYTASTVSDKTGYALTVGERTSIADAMLDEVAGVETGLTVRQWLRLAAAALFGKLSGVSTSAPKFRDTGDTKNRISASTSSDGRSSVTLDSS